MDAIELLDEIYRKLIENACHDEGILTLVDELQNKIEEFYNTNKEDN